MFGSLCCRFKCVPFDGFVMFDDVSVEGLALALGYCCLCAPVYYRLDTMLHVFLKCFLKVSDCTLEITLIDGPD